MTSQRDAWLAQNAEDPLEPGLPICDPHHHFWDRVGDRYLLDQLAQDLGGGRNGGHKIEQTVFIECGSMYRARGPEELRSVGETEFVQGIAAVASCPNMVVKLGGFGNLISGYDWHQRPVPPDSAELAQTITPWLMFCIEQFGPERCMFESNFPVDKASYAYTTVWNAFKRVSRDFSTAERAALFQGTAVKAYRLQAVLNLSLRTLRRTARAPDPSC